ncbi:hypothetical protein KMP13_16875 [Epibacterium ulvae]|nr:hypothetical protein [Epibacterium ulvae]
MLDFPDHAADHPGLPEKEAKALIVETLKRPYYFVHIPKCDGRSVAHALQGYYLHAKASE